MNSTSSRPTPTCSTRPPATADGRSSPTPRARNSASSPSVQTSQPYLPGAQREATPTSHSSRAVPAATSTTKQPAQPHPPTSTHPGRERGLAKHITPHALRHTVITMLRDGGVAPGIMQLVAGHASYQTTATYSKHHTPAQRTLILNAVRPIITAATLLFDIPSRDGPDQTTLG
ncbi:tyrosine-type recombinase/integrase [Nonomuraea sp. GTA35]|uniref:tyrosine-type recombinase/integrase n=1 Tax=Nonomuraea sp. GTA35 TaxID=1676746 RepID=UPI0035BF6F39